MKKFILKGLYVGLLMISNIISAQNMRTEDDVMNYLSNATSLDLIEGVYFSGQEYYACVYNSSTDVFDYYQIDSRTRELVADVLLERDMPKFYLHIRRTSKYTYTYWAYITNNGITINDTKAVTPTEEHPWLHFLFRYKDKTGNDKVEHYRIELKNKVYPSWDYPNWR